MAKRDGSKRPANLKVLGTVSGWVDSGQACFGALLSFRTIAGRRVNLFVRRSEFGHPKRLIDRLLDAGLPKLAASEVEAMSFQHELQAKDHYVAVQGPGWKGRQYVFPDGSVIGKGKKLLLQSTAAPQVRHEHGELAGWIKAVAMPARHSTPMITAISLALATYLLGETGVEGGTIHLTSGESGAGKTLTQLVAQSVGRRASRQTLTHWDATDTSYEELAIEHNDGLLALDEIARLAASPEDQAMKAEAASFRMAGGISRLRSRRYSPTQATSWRVLVLSSGETSIAGLADRVGRRRLQGDSVRMIDLPAVRVAGRGVFDLLPANRSTESVARRLERGVRMNYGVAGKAFVRAYLADRNGCLKLVKELMQLFVAKCGVADQSWERRFASRFALAYAAAMLAKKYQILPWSDRRIFGALSAAWMDARCIVQGEAARTAAALNTLKSKARSRLVWLQADSRTLDKKARSRMRRYGVVRKDKRGHAEYLVRPDAFRKWLGDGAHPEYLLKVLQNRGALVTPTPGKLTSQVVMPGEKGRSRVYRISERLL